MADLLTLAEAKPLPFEQAQKYWAGKFPVGYDEYKEMADDAKSLAFSAAGYGTAQDLAVVYDAVGRAVAEGLIFKKFQQDILQVVKNTEWSKARQELIYRNNIQTAYSVGRYDRQQQAKDLMPYLMYDAVNDRRTRPTHHAMDNRVYPIDDPVWDDWTPPCGHRCRCSTRSVSDRQIERRGYEVKSGPTTGETVEIKRGKKTVKVPLKPDEGWATNPGKVAWKPDLDKLPKPLAKEYLKRLEAWEN